MTEENFPTENPLIVLDVETKKTFEEVGAVQSAHEELGVSFLGVYSYTQNKYFGFFEEDLDQFEKIMQEEKPTVIGFNSVSFDLPVIQPYMSEMKLLDLPQIDLLADIYEVLGHRVKLESVAQATLGEGKSGTGLDAIRYYREKNFEALSKYCLDDVRITKELYDYGVNHGRLFYTSAGEPTPVDVPYRGESQSIEDKIKEAVQAHKEVEITVLDISESGSPRKFDTTFEPRLIDNVFVRGYCHTHRNEKAYETRLILDVRQTGKQIAHQTGLF